MVIEKLKPGLRDIVAPGPVERGLYLIDKSEDAASNLQDRIVDLLWWDSVATPGAMPSRSSAWRNGRVALESSRQHRRHSRIGALNWIDTGRLFNVGTLLSQARLRGLEGNRVARAVRVQYPVDPLAYLGALERIPNAALCALGENERQKAPTAFSRIRMTSEPLRSPSSIWWTPLVVISDLFLPLEDSSLPFGDKDEIRYRFLERLEHLKERAVVIAFTDQGAGRDRFFTQEVLRLGTRIGIDRPESLSVQPVLEMAQAVH